MPLRGYLNCFFSLGFTLAVGLYVYRPSTVVGLVMMLFFVAFGINFLWNMVHPLESESERGTLLYLTLGFALIAFFFAPRVGAYARDAYFRASLPELKRFVATVVPAEEWSFTPAFPAPYRTHRELNDSLVIDFQWGKSAFQATCLTYAEDEHAPTSPPSANVSVVSQLDEHWFYLSY